MTRACAATHPLFGPCRLDAHDRDVPHAAAEPYEAHRWRDKVVVYSSTIPPQQLSPLYRDALNAKRERRELAVIEWVDLGPRCPKTDLYVDQCAHCTGRTGERP